MGVHHMLQQQHQQLHLDAIHKPEREQSVRSQLSETNELLLEQVQGVRRMAGQRPPPRVTGNPFADPEEIHDLVEDSQLSAPMAAQHELEDSTLSTQFPMSSPSYTHEASREAQAFAHTDVEAVSAWDALSAPAAPSANNHYESRVQLHSSEHYLPAPLTLLYQ